MLDIGWEFHVKVARITYVTESWARSMVSPPQVSVKMKTTSDINFAVTAPYTIGDWKK